MKAFITGASSGIGRAIAYRLADMGYDLILTARRETPMLEIKNSIKTNAEIIVGDISDTSFCLSLAEKAKEVDILINNAGFGVFGKGIESDLDRELNMLDVNLNAVHILNKMFLKEFVKKDKGYILNVASSASFFPGPLFASYYASKIYVKRYSYGLCEELRRMKSKVMICCLCPGPVDTEFNDVANVKFSVGALTAEYVAEKGIKGLLAGKKCVTPGFLIKCTRVLGKLMPDALSARFVYNIQEKKSNT